MAKPAPKLVHRDTRELTVKQGKSQEITATIAVNHYTAPTLQLGKVLELELVKHGSTTKTVSASVEREELVGLAHWLLQNYDTAQGGA